MHNSCKLIDIEGEEFVFYAVDDVNNSTTETSYSKTPSLTIRMSGNVAGKILSMVSVGIQG